MKIYTETNLANFEFYGGAQATVEHLSRQELEVLDQRLQEDYPEIDAIDLNDLFEYNEDYIAQLLGYSDWQELLDEEDRV